MHLIQKAFDRLLQFYGPQGWWPTTPPHSNNPLYTPKKSLLKNSESEKVEICLGAILTQNTNWENVVKALTNLSENSRLHIDRILSLSLSRFEKLIRPSGYFRQKAVRVRSFFQIIQQTSSGQVGAFLKGSTARVRKKLLAIKGIGPETADSMLLYAQGHPIFVVDAYTRRIGTRWGVLKENQTYTEIQKQFMKQLPRSVSLYGEYHALLVQLAKDFCKKKPRCSTCPLRRDCRTGKKSMES